MTESGNPQKAQRPRKAPPVESHPAPAFSNGWMFAFRMLDVVTNLGGPAIAGATIIAAFYFISVIVHDLAGKETKALIFAQFLADMKVTEWLSYGTNGVLGMYAWKQKRLREKTIERYAPERKASEERINPHRGTSGLTKEGRTHPDDK